MAYKPIDARRDEFRKYLERTGVLDMFTKVLSKLMTEDRPEDAIEYIRKNFGDALNDRDSAASLSQKLEEANQLIEELRAKLRQYEPMDAVTDSDTVSVPESVHTASTVQISDPTAEATATAPTEATKDAEEPMQVDTPAAAEPPAAEAPPPQQTAPATEAVHEKEKTEATPAVIEAASETAVAPVAPAETVDAKTEDKEAGEKTDTAAITTPAPAAAEPTT